MEDNHQPIKLTFSHLPKETHIAFELLSKEKWLKDNDWYLAGGTALTLQCDHRTSVDLDFFTKKQEFDVENIILKLSSNQWITSLREKGTLYGELKGAKISFISYPYFIPKEPFISYKNINVLDIKDIAVMKIMAISQRGKKRDFFDLYWYAVNKESLIEVLERVKIQYPNVEHNYHHIIKSFTYFEEAEEDPDPQIFFNANWDQVKKFFLEIAPGAANKFL